MGSAVSNTSHTAYPTTTSGGKYGKGQITQSKSHGDISHIKDSKQDGKGGNYTTTKQAGGVATVIIKVGQEEYMNYDGAEQITYGKLGDKGDDHQLYKQNLALVSDSRNGEAVHPVSIQNELPTQVYMANQLRMSEFSNFLSDVDSQRVCKICVRVEPVLFIDRPSDNYITVPCHLYNVNHRTAYLPSDKVLHTEDQCRDYELQVRKELVTMATITDDSVLYYYDTAQPVAIGEEVPTRVRVRCDDDLLTLSEIMSHINITHSAARCLRCPLSLNVIPELSTLCHLAEAAFDSTYKIFVIEDGEINTPRCHFATCLTLMAKGYSSKMEASDCCIQSDFSNRAVRVLIGQIPDGETRKKEVDWLLSCIQDTTGSNTIQDGISTLSKKQTRKVKREVWNEGDVYITQLYVLLIIFNFYCHQGHQDGSRRKPFSDWLRNNSSLLSFMTSTLSPLPLLAAQSTCRLGKSLVLVENSNKEEDYLCTYSSNSCANVRKIPGLPIYGGCQPSRQGLAALSDWLITKLGHSNIILVCVREDPAVLCNGEVYCLRYKSQPDQPITFRNTTDTELFGLQTLIKSCSHHLEINELFHDSSAFSGLPEIEVLESVYNTGKFRFLQVPLPLDQSPAEAVYEVIQNLVEGMLEQQKKSGELPALFFCCDTGKERTTAAMSIAGLVYGNAKGYGYGAGKGETERISIWDAQYTKGEFKAIQKIVSIMPGGHQTKREVDYILDQCFETSSMMHYHIREEIFVVFKKKQRMKITMDSQTKSDDGGICVRGPKKGTGIETDIKSYYKKLHKQSLDILERYAMLIVFNAYLNHTKETKKGRSNKGDKSNECTIPFTEWMSDVGRKSGMLDVLDSLSFSEFEDECPLKSRFARNSNYVKF